MASTTSATASPPRLHVIANLPPVISFSSAEEPLLEIRLPLQYSQPIIIALKRSRLWHLDLIVHLFFVMPAAVDKNIFYALTLKESKDKGVDKYRMLFPIGTQFLKAGEEYEVGVQQVQTEEYMIGDLEKVMSEEEQGSEWKPADGALGVIAGERCRFRVES